MAGSVPVERSSQRATNEVEPNKQKKSKQLRISFASGDADGSLVLKRQKIVADVSSEASGSAMCQHPAARCQCWVSVYRFYRYIGFIGL